MSVYKDQNKRTWYVLRKFAKMDWIAIAMAAVILVLDLLITFWDGNRYYNPFL